MGIWQRIGVVTAAAIYTVLILGFSQDQSNYLARGWVVEYGSEQAN